ncbi:MAG: chemotaxis protein MotB, partial [Alphaproteobacteria bacterium]
MADERPIVIKKVKKVSGGHHGGAWKVAYADFVTAMMAFFMLLWLLNVSDEVTLQGLADYFTPTNASMSNSSGAGDILAGTALEDAGASRSGSVSVSLPQSSANPNADDAEETAGGPGDSDALQVVEDTSWQQKVVTREELAFARVEEALKTAIQETPDLAKHEDQIVFEQTPEGLRIQLVDKDRRSMFKRGSADMYGFAERLLETVGRV